MTNQLTQITDKLYAVEVPLDAHDFERVGFNLVYNTDFPENGMVEFVEIDFIFTLVGSVTKDCIDFDCEVYVKPSIDLPEYKYGGEIHPKETYWDYTMNSFWMDSSDDSFISLLSSKDISFDGDTKILIIEKL